MYFIAQKPLFWQKSPDILSYKACYEIQGCAKLGLVFAATLRRFGPATAFAT